MIKPTILCVDDENDNVDALERLFRNKFSVLKATSGKEALKILDQHPEPISIILTDQRMPEMTGVEFLAESIQSHPESIRILLTGYTDINSVIAAVNSGQIYRYITKPWDPVDLLSAVDRANERFQMSQELKEKNTALSQALDELKTLDQAKNQFMILINHELKTPLTSLLSFSELLKETKLTEEQELCVARIEKSGLRLKNLVDDVMLVLAGETKTLKPKSSTFEIQSLNIVLSYDVQKMIEQRRQTLQFNWLDKKLIGDRELLTQVLQRLIHNAIKFGAENKEILVSASLTSPHRMKIEIFNEGPTIPASLIQKIMQPFFIDEDIMNHSSGMGLGLTICQSILKAHSSSLKFENKNNGVAVSFELPCL